MKKLIIMTFVIAFMSSCNNYHEALNSDSKSVETCIADNIDFKRYFSISKSLIIKVAESDLSLSIINEYLIVSDYYSIYNKINASASEIESYDSISIYGDRLMENYYSDLDYCYICKYSAEELANSTTILIDWIRKNPSEFENFKIQCSDLKDSGTQCKWIQLSACIGACALLPPIINSLCVVACYCEHCTREPGHPMNDPCGQTTQ